MKKDKIVVQLYILCEFLKIEEDIFYSFKKVSEIGFQVVQILGIGKIELKRLKEICDEFDFKVCVIYIFFERFKIEFDNVVEEYKILECFYIVIFFVFFEYRFEEGGLKFVQECNEIGKKLKEEGIIFLYYNYSFEFKKYGGKIWFEILIENLSLEYFMIEIDMYWVQFVGVNFEKWIRSLEGRIFFVYLKDMGMIEDFK